MNTVHKIISYKGQYFLREYETIKHHKNKIRYLREETVAKGFKSGNTEIVVHFEDDDKTVTLDFFSDREEIKKYLGKAFL